MLRYSMFSESPIHARGGRGGLGGRDQYAVDRCLRRIAEAEPTERPTHVCHIVFAAAASLMLVDHAELSKRRARVKCPLEDGAAGLPPLAGPVRARVRAPRTRCASCEVMTSATSGSVTLMPVTSTILPPAPTRPGRQRVRRRPAPATAATSRLPGPGTASRPPRPAPTPGPSPLQTAVADRPKSRPGCRRCRRRGGRGSTATRLSSTPATSVGPARTGAWFTATMVTGTVTCGPVRLYQHTIMTTMMIMLSILFIHTDCSSRW